MQADGRQMTFGGGCASSHPECRRNAPAEARFPFGRNVLITEDNWLIASEWEVALLNAGYRVLGIAVSAEESIEMCRQERPDFILMDIRLVGQRDGIHAAIDARRYFDVPSLFISAHDDPDHRRRALPARPIGWITKPVVGERIPRVLVQLGTGILN